ncbi:MAG: triose-phosphate isomerase [Clostridia bacterium]|nr:triose-phosphate isomerase [Clostridia bacterium]
MRRKLVAGNWKMHKNIAEAKAFAAEFIDLLDNKRDNVDVLICAPFTQLAALKEALKDSGVMVGAQNCHFEDEGAFTGEISVGMLEELGMDFCIVGHSERRQYFAESDETCNKKLHKLFETSIRPILCVGESLEEREAEKQFEIVGNQVKADLDGLKADQVSQVVIAYEPIWAIGTGLTASKEQANEMCAYIRQTVGQLFGEEVAEKILIQYGGSVKPNNASELLNMSDIDGALVGGASEKSDSFIQIVNY